MTPDAADTQVMQAMVDTMVGMPRFSYPARQNNAPKPNGEFAHIRVLEEYQVGIPKQIIKEQTDLETTFQIISPVKLRYRIGVVDTSGLPSSKIQHGWTSEAMKALMISSGYGFIRCTPISNEDAKLEKEWEYRKGFSVEMYTTRIFEEVVNNITSLQIGGCFISDTQESMLISIDINNT